MTPPRVSTVITAHDRREYLGEAVRSAIDAGADEIVVVRNFSEPIDAPEGSYLDVLCTASETGVKQATGVARASGEVVAFLDDDDLWEPDKVRWLRDRFSAEPSLVYLNHTQRPIDASGALVGSRHPEWARRTPSKLDLWDRRDPGALFDEIWPGNSSSTVVRRSWAIDRLDDLREVGWSADTFWLVAALLGGGTWAIVDRPLTRLRLHGQNMSQGRDASAEEFRRRHARMCGRFGRSYAAMAGIATRGAGPDTPLARYLAQKSAGFRFLSDLEEGTGGRRAAMRALVDGRGWGDRAVLGTALVAIASPSGARRLLYWSGRRRWRIA